MTCPCFHWFLCWTKPTSRTKAAVWADTPRAGWITWPQSNSKCPNANELAPSVQRAIKEPIWRSAAIGFWILCSRPVCQSADWYQQLVQLLLKTSTIHQKTRIVTAATSWWTTASYFLMTKDALMVKPKLDCSQGFPMDQSTYSTH